MSHIWYVKGTPSRLGLLLDISPRNLERVLYFATYIVTEVDEDERQRQIKLVQEDGERSMHEITERTHERINELQAGLQDEIAEIQASEKLEQDRARCWPQGRQARDRLADARHRAAS